MASLSDIRCIAGDELLPGVSLDGADADAVAWLLPLLSARLAAAGDIGAMLEAADAAAAGGGSPVGWLKRAVEAEAACSDAVRAELGMAGCARHQLLAKLGDAQRAADELAAAAASYEEAAEAAMEAGKAKLSMKYSALAEECAPEEGE